MRAWNPQANLRAEGMTVGVWEPFWLGAGEQRLYAALHRANLPSPRLGLVLAPPLLHEQPRSRRLLTELATALAQEGVPCVRFDYFGTGDSDGSGEQLDFASMRRDLQFAADSLIARGGVERIGVLAVRGATLPVFSWLRGGGAANLLVLWEPVVDGESWLAELETRDAMERRSPLRYPTAAGAPPNGVSSDDLQLMGYPVSTQLRRDIAQARVIDDGVRAFPRCWSVLREDADMLPVTCERVFRLPTDTPLIGGAVSMDASVFVTPGLQRVVDELAQALRKER
ncbi:hypothetical protein [Lysobacter niastensis]|uniref:Serine aminopeptidase S33 domain-containing protein n=1 Tax=Lysobacter niastensis TaxID=380629 RepID=A0ABS0B5V3_9GAMM|nr:hypothetical protein [Lysobacter niastensis]MBF6024301.1 hypothetical protein [Lysobacter niastensis]